MANITFNTQCDDSQQKRLNYRNNESTFIDGTEEVTRQRMVVRVVVHKVGGISQHKVKNKHGDDKADYDYPTGGSDAFKRGCFF